MSDQRCPQLDPLEQETPVSQAQTLDQTDPALHRLLALPDPKPDPALARAVLERDDTLPVLAAFSNGVSGTAPDAAGRALERLSQHVDPGAWNEPTLARWLPDWVLDCPLARIPGNGGSWAHGLRRLAARVAADGQQDAVGDILAFDLDELAADCRGVGPTRVAGIRRGLVRWACAGDPSAPEVQDAYRRRDFTEHLAEAIPRLTDKADERDLLRRRWGIGHPVHTLEAIARHFGITRQAVDLRLQKLEQRLESVSHAITLAVADAMALVEAHGGVARAEELTNALPWLAGFLAPRGAIRTFLRPRGLAIECRGAETVLRQAEGVDWRRSLRAHLRGLRGPQLADQLLAELDARVPAQVEPIIRRDILQGLLEEGGWRSCEDPVAGRVLVPPGFCRHLDQFGGLRLAWAAGWSCDEQVAHCHLKTRNALFASVIARHRHGYGWFPLRQQVTHALPPMEGPLADWPRLPGPLVQACRDIGSGGDREALAGSRVAAPASTTASCCAATSTPSSIATTWASIPIRGRWWCRAAWPCPTTSAGTLSRCTSPIARRPRRCAVTWAGSVPAWWGADHGLPR